MEKKDNNLKTLAEIATILGLVVAILGLSITIILNYPAIKCRLSHCESSITINVNSTCTDNQCATTTESELKNPNDIDIESLKKAKAEAEQKAAEAERQRQAAAKKAEEEGAARQATEVEGKKVKQEKEHPEQDLLNLTIADMFFDEKKYDLAINFYLKAFSNNRKKIPMYKDLDEWLNYVIISTAMELNIDLDSMSPQKLLTKGNGIIAYRDVEATISDTEKKGMDKTY